MNHEERQRLIHAPFLMETFSRGYPWGGIQTGQRDWQGQLLDNSTIAKGKRHYFTVDWKGLRIHVVG